MLRKPSPGCPPFLTFSNASYLSRASFPSSQFAPATAKRPFIRSSRTSIATAFSVFLSHPLRVSNLPFNVPPKRPPAMSLNPSGMSVSSPSSSSNTMAISLPTKWLPAFIIPATGPSSAPSPASLNTISALSSACPSAQQVSPAIPPWSISSGNSPNPQKSSPSPTPTSTSTESPPAPAANSATSPSALPPPNASPSAFPNSPPSSIGPTSASTPFSPPPLPFAPDFPDMPARSREPGGVSRR